MANVKGIAAFLLVGDEGSPSAGSFTKLEGQTNTTWDGATNTADTTDKDGAGWQTAVSVTRAGTCTAEGNFKTPTANRPQFNKLRDAWNEGNSIECEVLIDTDFKYTGYFYVTSLNITMDASDVVKYNITLTAAEALVPITA